MDKWRRHSDRAGRAVLRSPGRPGVSQREDRRRFWTLIAEGLPSERAAIISGVSTPVAVRWFREAGGIVPAMFAPSSKPLSGRYLSFAEREEIALGRAQGLGVCEIGRRLDRSASTISRELRRNADGAEVSTTVQFQPSGMPSVQHAARSRRSWCSMRHCGRMFRIDWPAW